ncbi:hypothetical protein NQ317_018248 [Molorchus minor]|uniref:EF-hand domain-containing protein n=1 Tax=Molorchus minor TaxID=1323400 RepID=A0ABQ9K4G7_9CUCU|nr:hypothetical protein NQ317_018248 [Molorchus minor]
MHFSPVCWLTFWFSITFGASQHSLVACCYLIQCDHNNDGYISIKELKIFIETEEENVPYEVIRAIHNNFDKNCDHVLDFEEFLEMLNSPLVKKTFRRLSSRYLKYVVVVPSSPRPIGLKSDVSRTGLYEEQSRCKKTTIGMVTLSIIQIILFYANISLDGGSIAEALKFTPSKDYEVWRYITHIFVHASELHLFPNIVVQILIGIPLELVHGWRVLVIYFTGALGGCLAHSVFMPRADLVGGSGGFYAFYTANIATVIMNWREMSLPIVQLVCFGLMTFFDPIYNFFTQGDMSEVSYVAHLGGAVVGLLLGVNILRNLKVTEKENVISYICLTSYVILMIVFVTLNIIKSIKR